jgi:hypothetical protein
MREVASAAGAGTVGIMIACYAFGVMSGVAIAIIAINLF